MNYSPLMRNLERKDKVKIYSVGSFLPNQVVKSDDLFTEFSSEKNYDIPVDWMSDKMGICERRMCDVDASPSSLAIPAAKKALANFPSLNPDHIDLVSFCGIERDKSEPATAHIIQHGLGLKAKMAFDMSNACFGFIDGLNIAKNLIETGQVRYALITTGEITTKLTRYFVEELSKGIDRRVARDILGFLSVGDAGGAVVLGRSEDSSGFDAFEIRSDSSHNEKCYYEHDKDGGIKGQMKMAAIVKKTLDLQKTIFEPTLTRAGWAMPDYLLTHQVGRRAFEKVVELGVAPEKRMIKSYDVLGNITSATFALNFDQLTQEMDMKENDKVYACYSGSGVVVGQFAYTY